MSAKYKSPSFLLPNEINTNTNPLNTDGNPATGTGINSLYSMDFNGSSDYIDVGNPTELQLTGAFSVSAWIKTTNTITAGVIVGKDGVDPHSTRSYQIQHTASGEARFVIFKSSSVVELVTGTTIINDGNWHNIIGINDGANLKIYVDGTLEDTNVGGGGTIQNGTANLNIGRRQGNGANELEFSGKIDEVAIFNRALNTTEIAALYGGTSPNIYPSNLMATDLGPVAYYPLGEQAQNTGYLDPSNPGSDMSGSEWQFPNGVLQDYVMDFDGTDNINSEANISSASSFTASIWINRDDSATQYIYGQWVDGTTASQSWVIQTVGGIVYFNVRDASLSVKSAISTTSLTTGVWYNIIAVWTGSNIKLYINNSLEDTTACSSMNNPSTAVKLAIGSSSNNVSPFNGKISNAVIWNSDQESNRDNIYNNGSPQTTYTVTPQNWWKLNADSVYTPSAPNYTKVLKLVNVTSTSIDSIDFTQGLLNNLSEFTVSFWYNRLTNGGNTGTILKQTGVFSVSQHRYVAAYSGIEVSLTTSNGTFNITASGQGVVSLNEWLHVSIVYDGSNITLYRNGTVADGTSIVAATGNTVTNTNNFKLEPLAYNEQFLASNLAFYNTALTSTQISTLFNFGTPETNISFSPQAWWKLDDQTAITDSSGNGNTGTNNGATDATTSVAVVPSWKIPSALPITTTPNYTTALEFNYKDSIGFGNSIGNLIGDNYTGGLSFSFWINPSATNSDDGVFNFLGNRISFVVRANSFRLYSSSCTSGQCFSYNYTNSSNEWSHCVISFLPSGSSFYLNGESVATWTYTDLNINGKDFYIGWYASINTYYIGKLSNFQIWNTNLSSTEASTLYNGGTPIAALSGIPQSSNLISWWKLNDSGSTIIDSAGNNNGSYTFNSATLVASDVLTHQPSNGVSTTLPSTALQQSDLQFDSPYSNYSLYFDGATYIDCTDISYFSGADRFSLSTWFKVNSSDDGSANRDIISKGTLASGTTSFFIRKGRNSNLNKISLSFDEGSTNVFSNTQIQNNVWYHVVAVYDGSAASNADRAKIYINGQNDTATISSTIPTTLVSSTQPLRIGRWASGTDFYGNIDETAIWQSVLTDAQILQVYNNGRPSDITSLSPNYWWRLGENAYFDNNSFVVPNSISGAPNGTGSGTITTMISADAPGTYANGIGDGLAITDRVGEAPLSTSNSQSYNMIPSDISPYVPQYVGKQIANNFSMTFSGVLDYISLGNPNILQITGAISLSFWFNSTASTFGFITKSDNGSYFSSNASKVYEIGVLSNTLYWQIGDGTNVSNLPHAFSSYLDGNWHHVVATWDGSTNASSQMLFVDGLQVGSHQATISSIQNKSNNVIISSQSALYDYVGKLDEVAIFDKALTADQVKFDLYQPSFPAGSNKTADIAKNPNLPTPVAWYRMGD